MPKYKVKPENMGMEVAGTSPKDTPYYPTVYFPISKEILDTLEVDEDVTVTIKGKVKMLESRQDGENEKSECRIELREVEVYSKGEYEKLSEDDLEDE